MEFQDPVGASTSVGRDVGRRPVTGTMVSAEPLDPANH
jgi:hypothetical protein